MKNKNPSSSWWQFSAADESFEAYNPEHLSRLYFPLCNEAGFLSAITPTLQGDIKLDQNHFLTQPVTTEDLHANRTGRNFWLLVNGKEAWSATGHSATQIAARAAGVTEERSTVQAGALWHLMSRENQRLGLKAEILNFIPSAGDRVEVMHVRVTNTGKKPVSLVATGAIPIYGRSADNLRDHRHVTSLLHRTTQHRYGVYVQPTMSFDERGHKPNSTFYAVFGLEGSGTSPAGSFPTQPSFIGEGGTLDAPRAVFQNEAPPKLNPVSLQGKEAMGAVRFRAKTLKPGQSQTFILLLGIAKERAEFDRWVKRYGNDKLVLAALDENKKYWGDRLNQIQIRTADPDFNRWTRWVTLQPMLRKIFGCSFLPDFDYGRGGRGWRDLWQDCLALLLLQPDTAQTLILDNFAGVRINGTNATIIGTAPGEFISDRNGISRTWMDHGVWPWTTTELYIHQTGDVGILAKPCNYFWDQDKSVGTAAPQGSVLEHLLVQHLTAYFNVGDHGNIRLEDADWNDGLDMAPEKGESVAFTAMYAGNLQRLSKILGFLREKTGLAQMPIARELTALLESKSPSVAAKPKEKRERLEEYRRHLKEGVSGAKVDVSLSSLAEDLWQKGSALAEHVRTNEWVQSGGHAWFNGYYDNQGRVVEGEFEKNIRITLTGQVFPIMAGVASEEQIKKSFAAVKRYLYDKKLGGFRLNSDFGQTMPDLGRAFSFSYGDKENGGFFSHMVVMFANALYQRGFVEEADDALGSLHKMALNRDVAKIYPGLPEYFNGEGRGLYQYLTGSASWYMLTWVTQVLGIRGQKGDLLLAPKLMPHQFGPQGQVSGTVRFAGKVLNVTYLNPHRKTFDAYKILSLRLDDMPLPVTYDLREIVVERRRIEKAPGDVLISVELG